ncbi:MAG: methyltransferase MtaB domain-containing protein [Bacteroidota bacterium]
MIKRYNYDYEIKIVDVANKQGKIAAGDSACGFGNTAMVLTEKKYIPKVFAPVIRISKELIKGGSYVANAKNGAPVTLDIIMVI